MNKTIEFLEALQDYYGLKYTKVQIGAMASNIGNPNKAYLLELYKVIINSYSGQYGKLPDLATIRRLQESMDPPETFLEPVPMLPSPIIAEAMVKAQEMKMKDGVANWDEVHRVGARLAMGNGSKWEKHWYWCMTENKGVWKKPEAIDD